MRRFVGTAESKLDGKNRIQVPVGFRGDAEQLAFRLSHQRPCIEAQSAVAFDAILASIARLPILSDERDDMETTMIAETALLRLDGDGRVILPAEMLREAGLTPGTDITIAGKGEKFEIWARAAWKDHVAGAKRRVLDRKQTLDVLGLNTTPQGVP